MTETQFGDNPYFVTGAGGVLQSVIFGFAGLDITDDGIQNIETVRPQAWTKVTVKSPFLKTQTNK